MNIIITYDADGGYECGSFEIILPFLFVDKDAAFSYFKDALRNWASSANRPIVLNQQGVLSRGFPYDTEIDPSDIMSEELRRSIKANPELIGALVPEDIILKIYELTEWFDSKLQDAIR